MFCGPWRAMFLTAAFLLPVLLGGYEGTPIGGEPYASWEEGSSDYFVMFNSLIDDQVTLYGEGENRQPDTCILESTFSLNGIHTPDDAIVIQAYLVWMGAVDPAKLGEPTDNMVHLKFAHASSGYTYEEDVIAGDEAKMLGDTTDPFLFQSVQFTTDVTTGCIETEPGINGAADVAYFTYRKDVTAFFQQIFDNNRIAEEPVLDGEALYGDYTFSGLDCTDHDNYKCRTTMVSNWSILVIYRSAKVKNKRIMLFPGLAYVYGETTTAQMSGLLMPREPMMRITTVVANGDATAANPALPQEIVSIRGDTATTDYRLVNDCNPLTGMSYEVYNSNSSIVGWDPEDESVVCVTGTAGGPDFFGVDVDTFLLVSGNDINLQEHLKLNATDVAATISVNADAILMNYLVASADKRTASFDIPPEASLWPYDNEKHFCSCRRSEDPENAYCPDRPMYYLIKVQNWGDDIAQNVTVIDELDPLLDYVPGSTEMATDFFSDDSAAEWSWGSIPDNAAEGNDAFPLSGNGYQIADTMEYCNQATWTCTDTRLIRFKVVPKDIPGKGVISNIAIIKEAASETSYRTNKNFPLNLLPGVCQELWDCPEPTKMECGGGVTWPPLTCDDIDCPEKYICDPETITCVLAPEFRCTNAKISFEAGPNSPDNFGSPFVIPAGTQDLVVGQLMLYAANCLETKMFEFDALRTKMVKEDEGIQLSNIELFYDANASGMIDAEEEAVAAAGTPDSSYAYFVLGQTKNQFNGGKHHFFLIRADVAYKTEQVPGGAVFHFAIEWPDDLWFDDNGAPQAEGGPLNFAEFALEPTSGYLIVARGPHDPSVPGPYEPRKDVPMLQVRVKATDAKNKITRITVNVPSSTEEDYAILGPSGVRSLSLYADTNGDGVPDGEPLAYVADFEDGTEAIFEGDAMEAFLTLDPGEEKYLIISGDLSQLDVYEKARISLKRGGLLLDTATPIFELPITSKEFFFTEEYVPDYDLDEDIIIIRGCGCSVVW